MLFVPPPKITPTDFLPAAEAAKLANVRLVSPPSQWDDEITQNVIREHPFLPTDQIVVSFRQKDETNGYALGSVTFANMPHISLPVIIANRELSPIDIMVVSNTGTGSSDVDQGSGDMTEDKVLPLTEENFSRAEDMAQLGAPVPDHQIQGVGYTEDGYNLRLPFRGRTVVASLMGASVEAKNNLGAILSQDKQASAGFLLNGTGDVVESWLAAREPVNAAMNKLASVAIEVGEAKIATVFPKEMEVASMFAESVIVEGGFSKVAVKVDVVDLANPEKGLSSLLVYADGTFGSAPAKVAAMDDGQDAAARAAQVISKIASVALTRGTYLMFQIDEHFTRPAKLASISARDDQRAVTLRLEDDLARSYSVILDRRVKTAQHIDGTWVIPMVSKVFQLSGVSTSAPMEPVKVAEWFDRQLPDQLVVKDGQCSLSIRGEAFGGQCSEEKMATILNSWISNGPAILAQAKTSGHIRFASTIPVDVHETIKKANAIRALPELAKRVVSDLGMSMDLAVKLAASIGDPQSVDMVLGTGFLTEDNLSDFVSMGSELDETIGKLARLLLAIRMGFPGDESATVVAMKSLQRIKERLGSAMTEVQS